MDKSATIIVCDECKEEFDARSIEFKTANHTINNTKYEVVYFICNNCKKPYIVCMLDYWGKRLQDTYVRSLDAYRKSFQKGAAEIVLKQKLEKVEKSKAEAMTYQKETLSKYKNLVPEGILI